MKKTLYSAILYSALALSLHDQGIPGPIELQQNGPTWKLEELSSTVSHHGLIGDIETAGQYLPGQIPDGYSNCTVHYPGSNDYIFCKGLSCGLSDRNGHPRDHYASEIPENGIVHAVLRR